MTWQLSVGGWAQHLQSAGSHPAFPRTLALVESHMDAPSSHLKLCTEMANHAYLQGGRAAAANGSVKGAQVGPHAAAPEPKNTLATEPAAPY